MSKSRKRAAFTLIELLVTIAVIGILLSVTLPVLNGVARRSRELACLANIREANTIATAWSLENRDLPPHFETSPYHIDPLGVPSMQMRVGDVTLTQPYFDQVYLWLRALGPAGVEPPRELTCTGFDVERFSNGGANTHAPSSYHLSSALLADPSVFTPGTMDQHTPDLFKPQPLTKALHPSSKSFLSEQSVAHIDGDFLDTLELRIPKAPVSFIDGHAAISSFLDTAHIRIPSDARSSRPFMHTTRGIHGSDI